MFAFKVSGEPDAGTRLDVVLTGRLPGLSRASVQKLSKEGKVLVNGEAQKMGYKLRVSDEVQVDYDADTALEIPEIELEVLYEDDDCVVINKPIGLLTHSKGAYNPEATVATWLSSRYTLDEGDTGERLGIVHRLDRATSGVMICAKNATALSFLQKQFSQRRAKKQYVAIVGGQLDPPKAIVEMPIERNPKQPQTFRVSANGKSSVTAYDTLKTNEFHSQVLLSPTTGRTHQLRVHMSYLKHAIVGDPLYGGEPADRLYLHAMNLEITIPSSERMVFEAPLPVAFDEFMG